MTEVGLTPPEQFADGADTGRPTSASSVRATGWFGTRTAIVSSPAVASSATGQEGNFGNTSVKGPGQNAAAAARARSDACTCWKAASADG